MTSPVSRDQPASSLKTAAGDLARTLVAHDVTTVYCLPGEETITLLQAIADVGIDLVVTRHEQHAAFMAAAHGRFTGSPGVVVTTLGPGFTNTLTGLAQASLCGFPVVAICGQKPVRKNSEGSFQVLDLPAIAQPVAKWAHAITDPRTVAADTARALSVATAPRPGPAVLEFPEDIAGQPGHLQQVPPPATGDQPIASPAQLQRVRSLLTKARTPVVLAGAGTQLDDVPNALDEFATATGIGVLASQMGKGALAEDHPRSLRAMSLNTADIATTPLEEADLIIAVGFQPVEHPPSSFNPDDSKQIIHVDTASPEIERHYQPDEVVRGDIAATLRALAAGEHPEAEDRAERSESQRALIESRLEAEGRPPSYPPSAHTIATTLRSLLDRDDIVALDNGAYKVWFARHYAALAPNTLVLDNALATMGAGLATAMVAARLNPNRKVVAVCGDGGFMMNLQDLETARRIGLDNLTVVVLNDDTYGFIAWHQDEQGHQRTAVDVTNPDFVALAGAFGIAARRVEDTDDLHAELADAIDSGQLNLVVCPLDQQRNGELK
ncbi:MAG: acetolactate synthase large subunit [Acidimicrobiales bacterium]|nr:acetolactate synthase large subunit [Acidimicrobiales bacterium]